MVAVALRDEYQEPSQLPVMKGASEGIYSGFELQPRNHMKSKIELSQFPQKKCFVSFRCGIKFVRQIDEFNTRRHSGRSGAGRKATQT